MPAFVSVAAFVSVTAFVSVAAFGGKSSCQSRSHSLLLPFVAASRSMVHEWLRILEYPGLLPNVHVGISEILLVVLIRLNDELTGVLTPPP